MNSVPWTHRLSVRLAVVIGLVTSVVASGFVLLSVRGQEEHILSETVRGAELLAQTIHRSLAHYMLSDDHVTAYGMIDSIAHSPGIQEVRLISRQGRVAYASDAALIGQQLERTAPGCTGCHEAGGSSPPATTRHRLLEHADGSRSLIVVAPIYNEPRCSGSCHAHPRAQRVLGVLNLRLSLDEMDKSAASLKRQTFALSGLLLFFVGVPVALVISRSVLRPVRELVSATRRVADEDLAHEIVVHENNELGVLARSFNSMTRSLHLAHERLTELMRGLERKVDERTEALRQAQAQLIHSEKMSSLGKLSASIAHEINNPLMGILTAARLLIRVIGEDPLPDRQRAFYLRHLLLVQRESERCRAIVHNLLDFARKKPLTLLMVDLNAAVEEALSLAMHQLSLQGITLEKSLEPALWVHTDFGQLRQAFLNVILNACDAMPQGGRLRVRTASGREPDTVVVEIADSGVGIPREDQSKVFDPFFTTKDKGTGLGLSVVYGIIERHRGRVELQSEPGQGTCLTFTLPKGEEGARASPGEPLR